MRRFKLYVSGDSRMSQTAEKNLRGICERHLGESHYQIEIVDLLERPHAANDFGVSLTPTVINIDASPVAGMLGDLSNEARVLRVLDIAPRPDAAPGDDEPSEGFGLRRILIIDDFEGIHESFEMALADADVELCGASSGESGIAKLERFSPDVIFLDLKMPGLDGVETLRRIRAQNATTPVIIMTAFSDEYWQGLQKAREEGCDFELLRKPLDVDELRLVAAVATGGFGRRPVERHVGVSAAF